MLSHAIIFIAGIWIGHQLDCLHRAIKELRAEKAKPAVTPGTYERPRFATNQPDSKVVTPKTPAMVEYEMEAELYRVNQSMERK